MRTKTNATKWKREQGGRGVVVGTHIDLDNCLARKAECLQIWLKEELVMPWHHIGGQAFKFLLGCHIASFSRCLTMCTAVVWEPAVSRCRLLAILLRSNYIRRIMLEYGTITIAQITQEWSVAILEGSTQGDRRIVTIELLLHFDKLLGWYQRIQVARLCST